jgi:hypothetical protein
MIGLGAAVQSTIVFMCHQQPHCRGTPERRTATTHQCVMGAGRAFLIWLSPAKKSAGKPPAMNGSGEDTIPLLARSEEDSDYLEMAPTPDPDAVFPISEVEGRVSTVEDASKARERMVASARSATDKERKMTLMQGIKLYPKAIAWSVLISTCIVMEGLVSPLPPHEHGNR